MIARLDLSGAAQEGPRDRVTPGEPVQARVQQREIS